MYSERKQALIFFFLVLGTTLFSHPCLGLFDKDHSSDEHIGKIKKKESEQKTIRFYTVGIEVATSIALLLPFLTVHPEKNPFRPKRPLSRKKYCISTIPAIVFSVGALFLFCMIGAKQWSTRPVHTFILIYTLPFFVVASGMRIGIDHARVAKSSDHRKRKRDYWLAAWEAIVVVLSLIHLIRWLLGGRSYQDIVDVEYDPFSVITYTINWLLFGLLAIPYTALCFYPMKNSPPKEDPPAVVDRPKNR